MKKTILLIFMICIVMPNISFAGLASGSISGKKLQRYCHELRKSAAGEPFKELNAIYCKVYITSFFDNMIIINALTKTKHFCLPKLSRVTKYTHILDAWVLRNIKIANRTTAAVALFAAFKKAFPCND